MDIAQWLKGLGLEEHIQAFVDNNLDETNLPKLTEAHLEKLGVTKIGDQLTLQAAIEDLKAPQPPESPAPAAATSVPAQLPPPPSAPAPAPPPEKSRASGSCRIFMSYGRRDAGELSARLRADLMEQGYEIWQDTREIRAGTPFMEVIANGLQSSDIMVALLSQHSVRTSVDPDNPDQQDSVCLKELSFACSAKPPIPVVPVRIAFCDPPFVICHLDYIDLAGWDGTEAMYQTAFRRLLEAIEEARRGKVRYRSWHDDLRPWNFADFLEDKRQDFVGREWLFEEIDNWCHVCAEGSSRERALLITGDPGTGKSALVAELIDRNPDGHVLAYHCCRAGINGTLQPGRFVRSLAAMIASQSEEYARLLSEPAVRDALSEAHCDDDPASGLEEGILAPLQRLPQPEQGVRYVLIDGLDEAMAYREPGGRMTIVDLLSSHLNGFPDWMRVVATTRKHREVLERLGFLRAQELDTRDPRNLADVDLYIQTELAKPHMSARLAASGRPEAEVREILRQKSAGNFLYVVEAFRGIALDQYRFEQTESLPPSLGGLYQAFFERHFSPGDASSERDFTPVRKALQVLVAARSPLSGALLARATMLDEEEELPRVLRPLSPYVPGRPDPGGQRRYALFHRSLAEWLTSEEQRGNDFYISSGQGHARLAEAAWSAYETDAASLESYELSYLPTHLIAAGRGQDLVRLLTDFAFLRTKAASLGPQSLIEDCTRALTSELISDGEDSEILQLIQGAILLSAHVLAEDADQLAGQLTGRLLSASAPRIHQLLIQARQEQRAPWLHPLTASLAAPGGPLLRTLEGHTDKVTWVAVAPDGQRAVSTSEDDTLKVWDLQSGSTLHTLRGHTAGVTSVAVTPGGGRCVSASEDSTLKIWDLQTGEAVRTLQAPTDWVSAVAMVPDGKRCISAAGGISGSTLTVWDLGSGESLLTLEGHTLSVESVAALPDGKRCVSASGDETLRVWDLDSGETLHTLEGHEDMVGAVAVTPDGRRCVSTSWDQTLRLWDLDSGEPLLTLEGHTGWVESVAILPDGRHCISASGDQTLKVWDLQTGECQLTLEGHTDPVESVAAFPDGRHCVSTSWDKTLKVWDLQAGEMAPSPPGHTDLVWSVAALPDGRRCVSASRDNTLRIWDLETGEALHTLRGHLGSISSVAASPDGRRCVSASDDGTLRVWDPGAGETLLALQGHTDTVASVVVLPDSQRCVSASEDQALMVWDLDTGEALLTLEGHADSVKSVALTPDGRCCVSASEDNTLRLWDLETGESLVTLKGHTDLVWSVAVLPNGRQCVSASRDQTLKVWDLETGQVLRTLEGHTGSVNSVAVLPDGRRCVSASWDRTLKVWDLETGETLHTLEGHGDLVCSLSLLPDGRHCVSGSWDKTLKAWDLNTGETIATYSSEGELACCAVSPDGVTVVAGGASGRMHFVRLEDVGGATPPLRRPEPAASPQAAAD